MMSPPENFILQELGGELHGADLAAGDAGLFGQSFQLALGRPAHRHLGPKLPGGVGRATRTVARA